MHGFCCFSCLLSPLVRLFSDCYEGWQMCPVAMFVGTVYFKMDLFGAVCVCMLPGVNPSTDLCQPSSHLFLSGNDRGVQSPTVTFLLSSPPHTLLSDMFRCGYHLPVSRSHVISSEDLVSETEEWLASCAEEDTYSTVEAATAKTSGSSYPTDTTLLSWFLKCIG